MEIAKLREKCQFSRRTSDSWYGRKVSRKLSIYITAFMVRFNIHAMVVTSLFLVSGLVSALFFFMGGELNLVLGALLLQFWYILDHVDGEVARYFDESSVTGLYFDEMIHYVVHPAVMFCIGWGLFREYNGYSYILAGFVCAISVNALTLTTDIKDMLVFKNRKQVQMGPRTESTGCEGKSSPAKRIFERIHQMCHFSVFMNIVTAAVFFELFFPFRVLAFVLWAYAFIMTVVTVSRVYVFVVQRRIDAEISARQR